MIPDHFLAEILAAPLDDLPRLILADWLQERAGEVACPTCNGKPHPTWPHYNCTTCGGELRVSNGLGERAEFIRIQCELAGIRAKCPERESRSMDYSVNDEIRWKELGGPRLEEHEGKLWIGCIGRSFDMFGLESRMDWEGGIHRENNIAIVSRGFVSEVRLPLAAFMGGICERCAGHGRHYRHHGPDADYDAVDCGVCHGECRTPAHGPILSRTQPVERWVLTDVEPHNLTTGWWLYRAEDYHGRPGRMPNDLFKLLKCAAIAGEREWVHCYDSRELAMQALSDACVEFNRRANAATSAVRPAPTPDHQYSPALA